MTFSAARTSLGAQTTRRMAYRVAGQVLALAALRVPVRRISIVALEDSDERLGEVEILDGYRAKRHQTAFVYSVGEWAADHSGASSEHETQSLELPDLSSIGSIREDIPKFGLEMIGPITGVAEALLVHEKLFEEQVSQIIITELKRRRT